SCIFHLRPTLSSSFFIFYYSVRPPPRSPLFPYTTLFRSRSPELTMALRLYNTMSAKVEEFRPLQNNEVRMYSCGPTVYAHFVILDRKSTRLNSSHQIISYAVFCLKKKTRKTNMTTHQKT